MSKLTKLILVTIPITIILGCGASKLMIKAPVDKVFKPGEGKAMVVFMRPSKFGYMIQSTVYHIKEESSYLIGVVSYGTKVAYEVEPGKNTFMVIGENADFMQADLLPNKIYYALVQVRVGVMKARFSLKPIHQSNISGGKFSKWMSSTKYVEKTEQAELWFKNNSGSIEGKRQKYWSKWNMKSDEGKKALTLLPEDGV